MRVILIILTACLVGTGCRSHSDGNAGRDVKPSAGKEKGKPKFTADNTLFGKIYMVNMNTRNVVLSFPIGWIPAIGRQLNVYREGLKVGEVKITGPQVDTNIAADLIAGEARQGDEAREN